MKLLKSRRLTLILISFALIFAFGVMTSVAQETEVSRQVPLPKKITIAPPSPDLPKEIAAFSGRFEGIWEPGNLPSILIVEKIDLKEAQVINAWGLARYFKAGYERHKAKVVGKGIQFTTQISWGGTCQFKFVMNEDLTSVHGERDCGRQGTSSITMKKIE